SGESAQCMGISAEGYEKRAVPRRRTRQPDARRGWQRRGAVAGCAKRIRRGAAAGQRDARKLGAVQDARFGGSECEAESRGQGGDQGRVAPAAPSFPRRRESSSLPCCSRLKAKALDSGFRACARPRNDKTYQCTPRISE